MKKLIYVAHPLGNVGDFDSNILEVGEIIKKCYKKFGNTYTFVSPVLMYNHMYYAFDYDAGMSFCIDLLDHCDELWLFGDWRVSRGCKIEFIYAKNHGKTVRIIDEFVTD